MLEQLRAKASIYLLSVKEPSSGVNWMKGFHLLKSLIEVFQQYVWCVLGKSQLFLYGPLGVQFFYRPDKITFPSSPNACLSSPAHITLTTFRLNRDLSR